MSEEKKLEKTREFYENFCQNKDFELSKMADMVIKALNKKNGNCPCRLEETPCPCPMLEDDLKEKGRCTCGLFVRKEVSSE